jgi:hypothetical protein
MQVLEKSGIIWKRQKKVSIFLYPLYNYIAIRHQYQYFFKNEAEQGCLLPFTYPWQVKDQGQATGNLDGVI